MFVAKEFPLAYQTFDPALIEKHMNLYRGYVKRTNEIDAYFRNRRAKPDVVTHALWKDRAFNFDGMRLHELYFEQFYPGGLRTTPLAFRLWEFRSVLREIGMIPGSGWAIMYQDMETPDRQLEFARIDEHQNGMLAGCRDIVVIDVWEHAYDCFFDNREQYLDAMFANLNWDLCASRLDPSTR